MSERSSQERDYHNKLHDLYCGACWANVTPAGQSRQDRRARLAVECAKISRGTKVLELGCGNGEFSKRFIGNGADMYCVDISSKLIEMLRTRYAGVNLKFETADIESLPYSDGYFDAVIGNGILHHLNLEICLREIYRVLKKRGKIFFCEPNMLNPEVFLETKIRWIGRRAQKTEDETAFIRWRLKKTLAENGFRNIGIAAFDFLQPITPVGFINIVLKLGSVLEKIPFIKEIAGSLRISAEK